jgi:hypothetical protein
MPERKVGRAVKGCSEIREKLSAMIDGMLPPDEIKAIEEHIASCASCAAALEDLRKVVGHLQSVEQVESPPWMTQKVMAKVRSLETAQENKGFFSWLFQPSFIKFPVGALATVILAVTTYFIFEGIITDMPVQKTASVGEPRKQAPADKAESAPAALPEKSSAPFQTAEKVGDSKPFAQKTPAPKIAPQQRTPMDDSGKKDTMENRLWQEEPVKSKTEAASPSVSKGGYRAAPPVAAPAPSAAREVERKETGAGMVSKRAKAAGMARPGQRDTAATVPGEDSYSLSKSSRTFVAERHPVSFHVVSDDPAAAADRIITALNEFRGTNIRKNIVGNKTIIRCEISAAWLDRFFDRLKKSGTVLEKNAPAFAQTDRALLTIEIVPDK